MEYRVDSNSSPKTTYWAKNDFFRFFFAFIFSHQNEAFLSRPKFHIFNNNFWIKTHRRPNNFFLNFFLLHIYFSRRNFLFLSKFVTKALQTNNKRTNKQKTNGTPRTIIIPRQDSFRILGLIM